MLKVEALEAGQRQANRAGVRVAVVQQSPGNWAPSIYAPILHDGLARLRIPVIILHPQPEPNQTRCHNVRFRNH